MKGTMLWRMLYLFCALAGCLAGYGIFTLTGAEIKPNTLTKDNTLVRESENSVFFDVEKEAPEVPMVTEVPVVTTAPEVMQTQQEIMTPENRSIPATPIPEPVNAPVAMPEETAEIPRDKQETYSEMPSLASQWVTVEPTVPTPVPAVTLVEAAESEPDAQEDNTLAETITYPAEIFGQVPVINRSDTYVSYFEFAYDLITVLEPEVKQRGLNMNSLLMKFAVKALFCGVDMEELDINAPIPRRLAALCVWLAAQVLGEDDGAASSKSAQQYVTDIGGCSSAEKKAVAYLYEQGILNGYQMPGQQFLPEEGLKTESEGIWLSKVKQCWQ